MKRNGLIWACPVLVLSLVACGGSTPPPEEPKPQPPVAAPAPEPEPTAEAKPETPPPEEDKPEPKDRRPLAVYNDPTEPVTVGFDGAVIRLEGGAELRIPSGSLGTPRNIFFTVNKKHKGGQGKLGDVYALQAQIPNQQVQVSDARASRPMPSSGDAFVVKLPIPGNSESANLAVESVELDDKGRGKSTWTVIARTKVETADAGNKAVFELTQLPDAHVHLTTRDPG